MVLPELPEQRCDRGLAAGAALAERPSLGMAVTAAHPAAAVAEAVQHWPLDQTAAAMAVPVGVARFG